MQRVLFCLQSEGSVLPEELLKLQHKVRVLEKSLNSEQTLSQEMHTALCQREQEYCELGELLSLPLFISSLLLLLPSPSPFLLLLSPSPSPSFLLPLTPSLLLISPSPSSLLIPFNFTSSEANYQRAQAAADKVKELIDIQDELQTMTAALDKSEKNSQR